MKRLFFFCLAAFISLDSNAQEGGLFLKGGVNFANVTKTSQGEANDANMLVSFHVGFTGDLAIAKIFSIQPSLLLTGKGSKLESGNPNGTTYYKATTNPLYIELPVNAVFKLPLPEQNSSFFFGAGPYIAIGVGGKRKIEGKFLGTSFSSKESIEFSNDDPTTLSYEEGAGLGIMRRFDYGLNGTAGFQLKGGIISVNYGYGLAKLQSGTNNDDDYNKHRVLSISVGLKL
jgi:hypothetical protein